MKQLLYTCFFLFFFLNAKSQTTYTWTGASSSSFSLAANWTPAGIPAATDNIVIITGTNPCVLTTADTIKNLKILSGTLDLGGNTIVSTGSLICNGGNCNHGTLSGTGPLQLFAGTTFGANISVVPTGINQLTFNGSIFNGSVNATMNNNYPSGNSAGNNVFNGPTILSNVGIYSMNMASQAGKSDVFNAPVTFNLGNASYVQFSFGPGNATFNGNITLSGIGYHSTFYLGVPGGSGMITMGPGASISCAPSFTQSLLYIYNLTQADATPLVLSADVNSSISLGSSTLTGSVNITAGDVFTQNCTYNGAVSFTKTGGSYGGNSTGGNTFNGTFTMTNQSNGSNFEMGAVNADVFNGDMYLNNISGNTLAVGAGSTGNQLNGNVYLSQSTGYGGIYLGVNGTFPICTLGAGKSIFAGSGGIVSGYIVMNKFLQSDTTAINLTATGVAGIYIQNNSIFNGAVNFTAPDVFVAGATFNRPAVFTKTGGHDNNNGGALNIFNGTCTINQQSSSGQFTLGFNSADQFNDNIIVTSTGSGAVNFGNAQTGGTGSPVLAAGKTILIGAAGFSNGALTFNNFTQLGNAPINIILTKANSSAADTRLAFGYGTVIGGDLTCSSPGLQFDGATFNGRVKALKTGSGLNACKGGNIFKKTTSISNSGSWYISMGNNNPDQFLDTSGFTTTGTGDMAIAAGSAGNIFQGPATFNNFGASTIYISSNTPTTSALFNNNIIVNSTSGYGIVFGIGTTTLTAGNTISVGSSGFSAGYLKLQNFTQQGSTPQNILFTTPSGNPQYPPTIQYGPACSFAGNVTSVSGGLLFNGCIFSGTTNCTKNGTSADQSSGGNIFTGASTITNSGTGYLRFGNNTADQFLSSLTVNNTGTYYTSIAHNSPNNIFNGPVTLNNNPSNSGGTIYFSQQSMGTQVNNNIILNQTQGSISFATYLAAGNYITQANGFSINSGTITGGDLYLYNLAQAGSTTGNSSSIINNSSTVANLYIQNSIFYDNFSIVYPQIRNVQNTIWNGSASFTKTGGNYWDTWYGGNTFNGSTTVTNQSANLGYSIYLANNAADAYNADVSFVQATAAPIYPNCNTNCSYAGNVTVTSTTATPVTFGVNANGIATFTGGNAQSFNKGNAATLYPTISRMVMNKSANALTLNTRINISNTLTLTSGNINTTASNLVNMNNGSGTGIGSTSSFINGPMNYDMAASGTRTLNFPIGKVSDWRPAVLNLNHSNANPYTYNGEVFDAPAPPSWTFPPTIDTVSGVHYWVINRYVTGGTVSTPSVGLNGNQTITLYFDVNDQVYDGANLTIVKNTAAAPTAWIDIGGTGGPAAQGGIALAGSVSSTSNPSAFNSFSTFTLGSKIGVWNPLPVEMLYFTAKPAGTEVKLNWATATEINNDYFEVERSQDGKIFEHLIKVNAYGTGNSTQTQIYQTIDNKPYNGRSYYRLKQFDKNGAFKYVSMATINFDEKSFISVYPNPVSTELYINASSDYENADIKIIDALGRTVFSQTMISADNNLINTSNLQPGLYHVIISNGTDIYKTKITVQR